jgi:hypothetical protein
MSKYEEDFYTWTQEQVRLLRDGSWHAVDVAHVAEEIEDLGNEQVHAVESHLRVLLAHLLKWQYQPHRRRRSWRLSCLNARDEIDRRLQRNPGLRPQVPWLLAGVYPKARRLAEAETGLPRATFPEACPWTLEQVLDEDFWPEERPEESR